MDEGLLHKKLRTLEQQRAQSDDLNALLTREGGLHESQHMTCKNLKAAVAVSKQPGFFEYHKHSAEVQRAYDRKTCNQMVKKIARTQQDLDAIERTSKLGKLPVAQSRKKIFLYPPLTVPNMVYRNTGGLRALVSDDLRSWREAGAEVRIPPAAGGGAHKHGTAVALPREALCAICASGRRELWAPTGVLGRCALCQT